MSYIPTRDSLLEAWALNWTTRVTAAPTTYGLTAGIAVTCAALYTTWHNAYVASSNPVTRTPVTIAAKDSAKGAMVPILRLYSQQVKANNAISNSLKTDLGIHVDDTTPTPIPPPSTMPVLTIVSNGVQEMTLRFADELTPTSRSKPPGTAGLLLFRTIATAAASDPDAALFDGLFSRIPVPQVFDAGDVGKVCTYWAKWCNSKGDEGPWSAPVHRTIT